MVYLFRIVKIFIIILSTGLLGACCPLPAAPTFTVESGHVPNAGELVSTDIVYLADNQFAMITSEPIDEQSFFIEQTIGTAHRRAALDRFSLDVVKHILHEKGSEASLIIHGGDLLNNSCTSEFETAVKVMNGTEKPWFMAPGNHDGFYLGISSPTDINNTPFTLDTLFGWAQVCVPAHKKLRENDDRCASYEDRKKKKISERGEFLVFNSNNNLAETACSEKAGGEYGYIREVMDKYSFTQSYIKMIFNGQRAVSNDLVKVETNKNATNKLHRIGYEVLCASPRKNVSLEKSDRWYYLREICWTTAEKSSQDYEQFNTYFKKGGDYHLFDEKPWENFVLQQLRISHSEKQVDLIILDTSNYEEGNILTEQLSLNLFKWPKLFEGAAGEANLSAAQMEVLKQWIKKLKDNESTRQVIVFGHHPLEDFNKESKNRIRDWFSALPVTTYVSGDTHDGYDVIHLGFRNNKNRLIREVNIGSTIDAPLEYALFGKVKKQGELEFGLHRYFLTPGMFANDGNISRDGTYGNRKIYGELTEPWKSQCENKFGAYNPDAAPHDPLLPKGMKSQEKYRRLLQADFLPFLIAGIPCLTIELSEVCKRNRNIYKVNRLLDLLEVYEHLYEYAGIDFPKKETKLKTEALGELEKIDTSQRNNGRINTLKELIHKEKHRGRFDRIMRQLTEVVDGLEKDLAENHSEHKEKINDFRLCSALFEAYREADQ